MDKVKDKFNRFFTAYVNIIAFLVLSIFMFSQFIVFREILYDDLSHDAELEANILARAVANLTDIKRNQDFKLSKEDEEKILTEIKSLSNKNSNIVKLTVFSFDSRTSKWHEFFSYSNVADINLTATEKKLANLLPHLNHNKKDIWFTGDELVAKSTAYTNAGNDVRLKLSLDVDGNYVIHQEFWFVVLLTFLMVVIGIILTLQYRLLSIKLYKPLDNLIHGMKIISTGNMDFKIPVGHRDELGSFIESFNEMVAELKKSRQALEKELSVTKEQREKIFKTYKDVIFAVTQGKFLLVKSNDMNSFIEEGDMLAELVILKREDVGQARRISKQVVNGLPADKIQKMLLCVSEAATNIVKHAGSGIYTVKKLENDSIRFIFMDHGPGMDFDHLPSMLFYKGFSTKISLGFGFNLIYNFADKMILSTSNKGTIVIFDIAFANQVYNLPGTEQVLYMKNSHESAS